MPATLRRVARYLDVHPDNPQPRAIAAAGHLLRDGGLIAYPTDSCYALGCRLDNAAHEIDAVLDSGDCGEVPTTVVDFSAGDPVVRRRGAGDPARFEPAPDGVSPY